MKIGLFDEKLTGENFDVIVIKEKYFSTFFDNKSNIKEGIWKNVRKMLKSDGKIRLENIKTKIGKDVKVEDWTRIISQIAFYFFPFSEENNDVSFQRLETMTPAIISPHIFDNLQSNSTFVDMLQNAKSEHICKIIKDGDITILGKGSEGTVFYNSKWNSEVVIKKLENIGRYVKIKDGNDIKMKIGLERPRNQESISSAMLDILGYSKTTDKNQKDIDYMITMQRTVGFFGCRQQIQIMICI